MNSKIRASLIAAFLMATAAEAAVDWNGKTFNGLKFNGIMNNGQKLNSVTMNGSSELGDRTEGLISTSDAERQDTTGQLINFGAVTVKNVVLPENN